MDQPCFGHCRDCDAVHFLGEGNARHHGEELMREFKDARRLDYLVPEALADPRLSLDNLFPGTRGHMFGVLECLDENGATVVLRAFSSLHDGVRTIDGWVPPILSDEIFDTLVRPGQIEIKRLTAEMKVLDPSSGERKELASKRRQISQTLMPQIHERYQLRNFRGESRLLKDAFNRPQG
ncbi:MAG: hypothetical protein ACKVHO_17835, partial [Verrucomicrobiia bacterium]